MEFAVLSIGIIVLLKFLVPGLLLRFPFAAAWGNYVLDVLDGDILQSLGMAEYTYQLVDKGADFFSYVMMLLLGLRWRIRTVVIVLFAYRAVGQTLFFATGNEFVFFIFQNFLEPLVMAYTLLLFVNKGDEARAYASYRKRFFLIWAIIITYKVWNEWYLHFANIDLSTLLFGIGVGG